MDVIRWTIYQRYEWFNRQGSVLESLEARNHNQIWYVIHCALLYSCLNSHSKCLLDLF